MNTFIDSYPITFCIIFGTLFGGFYAWLLTYLYTRGYRRRQERLAAIADEINRQYNEMIKEDADKCKC